MKPRDEDSPPRFLIPLPDGRVARVPLEVLLAHAEGGVKLCHGPHENDADVTAHHMSVDAATSSTVWHTEWEYGPCQYTDETGYPQQGTAWHRHPLGTEYTEIFQQ
jgi:hypothetical protein